MYDVGASFITPMPNNSYLAALDMDIEEGKPFLSNSKSGCSRITEAIGFDERTNGKSACASLCTTGCRIFLAGDACHCHSLGGQGMNTGIQDAINLGWKLIFVLKGLSGRVNGATATPLSLSELEDIAQKLLAASRSVISNWFVIPLSDTTAHGVLGHWIFSFYNCNCIHAGDRWPYDHLPLPSSFDSTKFTIVLFEGVNGALAAPLSEQELEVIAQKLVGASRGIISNWFVISSSDGNAHKEFGVHGQCGFLVRPDGYVGLRMEPVKDNEVLNYLYSVSCAKHFINSLFSASCHKLSSICACWATVEYVDVLIVGAGPTGLTTAAELVRNGLTNILIVDRAIETVLQTKSAVVWPRSLELLERYEGVVEAVSERCLRVKYAVLRNREREMSQLPLHEYFDSKYNFGAVHEQWYMEKCLIEYLDRNGVQVMRSPEVVGYEYDKGDVKVKLKTNDDKELFVKAKYVVGCDGARSTIRKLMKFPFSGEVLPHQFLAVHFTTKEPLDIRDDALTFFMYDVGECFMTTMPNNSYLVVLDMDDAEGAPFLSPTKVDAHGLPVLLDLTKDAMQKALINHCTPLDIDQVLWASHYRVNQRIVEHYWDGSRIFLAGDACHCHSAIAGQGMNTGIQDAVNLGWKLAFVLKGLSGHHLLASYESERLPVGEQVIELTTGGQKMASNRNKWVQALRNCVVSLIASKPFVVSRIAQTLGEISISYHNSVLSAEYWRYRPWFPSISNYIHAGDRWPFHHLSLSTSFDPTKFTIVLFEGTNGATLLSLCELEVIVKKLVGASSGIISNWFVIPSPDVNAHKAFKVHGQCGFLVRPDGYVGLRMEPIDENVVLNYLRGRFSAEPPKAPIHPWAVDWMQFMLAGLVSNKAHFILMCMCYSKVIK
ncbi:hypothetical protein THRCLA_04275 [Thraustotheca clavata]|uniref:FAD-binding domain-containing protein n=1 Tax=Thraustotheca clavata TaxID=74557 RepID=A0A1V9ZZJ7_9STRA|nr:hypothetical protein THRCLA_04275 [Thraustotheca clavata]